MTASGICTNAKCPRAALRVPIELYAGPGQFCPDCGERLTPCEDVPPPPPPARTRPRTTLLAAGTLAVIATLVVAMLVGRPLIGVLHVRVCSTPTTDRVVREIVDAFRSQRGGWPYVYDVGGPDDQVCDVRFRTATAGDDGAVIARDGIVAIVNPRIPVSRISLEQLRDVLAGRITDWKLLGAPAGPIVAAIPADRPDAMAIVSDRVMHESPFGAGVVRTLTADAIVRTVSSPSGVRTIGIVDFGGAEPAKVLALDNVPPSTISIGDERYPLTLRILVGSDFRRPRQVAVGLIAFALSADARSLVTRTALVSKNGL